tara:strand:- start:86 stop:277 length:192 start_codon:yes stop_codon:yes gene_type:complete
VGINKKKPYKVKGYKKGGRQRPDLNRDILSETGLLDAINLQANLTSQGQRNARLCDVGMENLI